MYNLGVNDFLKNPIDFLCSQLHGNSSEWFTKLLSLAYFTISFETIDENDALLYSIVWDSRLTPLRLVYESSPTFLHTQMANSIQHNCKMKKMVVKDYKKNKFKLEVLFRTNYYSILPGLEHPPGWICVRYKSLLDKFGWTRKID